MTDATTIEAAEAAVENLEGTQGHTPKDLVIRNIDFEIDDTVKLDWHSGSIGISTFMNALSLLFPEGETFFIDSTRPFLKDVKDPKLKKELKNFMTQEAIHTREHIEYNKMLKREGLNPDVLEKGLKRDLDMGRKMLPAMHQLGITVALEHWTGILAARLLDTPEALDGAHPEMRNVWLWHAIEESEHKSVCFDLMAVACKDEKHFYRARIRAHVMTLIPFMWRIGYFYAVLMKQSGNFWNLKEHWRTFKFVWGKPGILRKVIPDWFDFFRKDFHPWDHDNTHHITQWDEAAEDKDHAPAHFIAAE